MSLKALSLSHEQRLILSLLLSPCTCILPWLGYSQCNKFIRTGIPLHCRQFFLAAPKVVRQLQLYQCHVTLFEMPYAGGVDVRARLTRNGEQYSSSSVHFMTASTRTIQMIVRLLHPTICVVTLLCCGGVLYSLLLCHSTSFGSCS